MEGVTSVSLTLLPNSDTPDIAQCRADMATYVPGQRRDVVALLGYGGPWSLPRVLPPHRKL